MGLVPITNLAIPSFLACSVVLLLHMCTVASFQRLRDPACYWRSFFHIYAQLGYTRERVLALCRLRLRVPDCIQLSAASC